MITLITAEDVRNYSATCRADGKTAALVPTLGGLHAGHVRQIEMAKEKADVVVVSIYLDPDEFGPNEDYDLYPRTPDKDREFSEKQGVDAVFMPKQDLFSWQGRQSTYVVENEVSSGLCGRSRSGHFRGVATTFLKLWHMLQPSVVVINEHRVQRLAVIRRVCRDLFLPVEVYGAPMAREPDGLACDTRNRFLNENQRIEARQIHRALLAGKAIFDGGNSSVDRITAEVINSLRSHRRLHVLYAHLVDRENLNLVRETRAGEVLLCTGVLIDQIRLIDHVAI